MSSIIKKGLNRLIKDDTHSCSHLPLLAALPLSACPAVSIPLCQMRLVADEAAATIIPDISAIFNGVTSFYIESLFFLRL